MLDLSSSRPYHACVVGLTEPTARKLIRLIMDQGRYVLTNHALGEMAADDLSTVDVENVLKGGVVLPAEYENGEWRYRIQTAKMCVVVTFDPEPETEKGHDSETELVIVTVWRIKR